jgi:hypothetical protein
MASKTILRKAAQFAAAGAGVGMGLYAAHAGMTWLNYGRARRTAADEDAPLDRVFPEYEIVERHSVRVRASPEITFAAAQEIDLEWSPAIRAIFAARELLFGTDPESRILPKAMLAQMKARGWGTLAEIPGREIVMGGFTQPWLANVAIRALPPEEFVNFREPGYVKIAWTLRVDPAIGGSIFRTETRAVATSPEARAKFRRYWSLVSPGIVLIRKITLRLVKKEAERRARDAAPAVHL